MIAPKKQMINILELSEVESKDYAEAISVITKAYNKLFNTSFPYSSGIHQAPTNGKDNNHWHWHMSFYPPLLRSASVKKIHSWLRNVWNSSKRYHSGTSYNKTKRFTLSLGLKKTDYLLR